MRAILLAGIAAFAVATSGCATQTSAQVAAAPQVINTIRVAPGGLYEIVHNPTDGDLYIAAIGPRGANAAAIARIDAASVTAGQHIDVASNPLFGLGLNARTQTLYGTDTRNGVVSAINLRTSAITTIRREGETPHLREIIVDEAANKVYASIVGFERDGERHPSQIWVINGATHAIERVIDVETDGLTGIALDATSNRLFGTGMSSNEVVVVDLATGATTTRWPTQSERPTNLVYDSASHRLFVASQSTGDLTVLDARTGAVIAKVPTGEGALSVAFNAALNQAYVANRQAGTVTIVNAADYSVLANLDAGTFPQTIAIDRSTNLVYVTNKARGLPRDAAPGTPVPDDPEGDTLTVIRPN